MFKARLHHWMGFGVVWALCLPILTAAQPTREPTFVGLALENDAFANFETNSDRNYTMGVHADWAGEALGDSALSILGKPARLLSHVLLWADDLSNWTRESPQLSFGTTAYTPDDLEAPDVKVDDRPYSSLVFATYSETYVNHKANPTEVINISGTLGFLGLDVAKEVQTFLHKDLDFDPRIPGGWHNQISDGGEPTAQFNVSRIFCIHESKGPIFKKPAAFQLWAGPGFGLGYRTHISATAGTAIGWMRRKFYQHAAGGVRMAQTGFGSSAGAERNQQGTDFKRGFGGLLPKEFYAYAEVTGAYIPYDVSIQGQFRGSNPGVERGYSDRYPFRYFTGYGLAASWDGFTLGAQIKHESKELKIIPRSHEVGLVYFQLRF